MKKKDDGFVTVSAMQHAPEPIKEEHEGLPFETTNQDMHPSRPFQTHFTYFKKYDNLKVHMVLMNGEQWDGVIHMKLNDNYDFELELDSGRRMFFMKHAIAYLYEIPRV